MRASQSFIRWARVLASCCDDPQHALEAAYEAATTSEGSDGHRDRALHLDLNPAGTSGPFDYQEELADKLEGLITSPGQFSSLVALPTGAGKTRTAAVAILRSIGMGNLRRVVWTAPALELLDQARATFANLFQQEQVRVPLRLSQPQPADPLSWTSDNEITFVTSQLLTRRSAGSSPLGDADLIVLDEAHYAGAPELTKALRAYRDSGVNLIGLSATPGRSDDLGLSEMLALFDANLLVPKSLGPDPVQTLQDRGILSALEFHLFPIASALPGLRRTSIHERALSIDRMIMNEARFRAAIEAVEEATSMGRCLVYCADVLHACATAVCLRTRGLNATVLTGEMGKKEREEAIEALEIGRVDALINIRVLTTGYDFPRLAAIAITSPVTSPILYEQMVGRVARGPLTGGTHTGHVFQLDDHLRMHGLPQSYHRFADVGWT